jgi:hypothetical protein
MGSTGFVGGMRFVGRTGAQQHENRAHLAFVLGEADAVSGKGKSSKDRSIRVATLSHNRDQQAATKTGHSTHITIGTWHRYFKPIRCSSCFSLFQLVFACFSESFGICMCVRVHFSMVQCSVTACFSARPSACCSVFQCLQRVVLAWSVHGRLTAGLACACWSSGGGLRYSTSK